MSNLICIIKTATKYWLHGRLVPSWDLKMHIAREMIHRNVLRLFPSMSEEEIGKVNVDKLQKRFAKRDMPQTDFPLEKGVYGEVEIVVSKVDVGMLWFDNVGVAEEMLRDLAEHDQIARRVIKAEMVASWESASQHRMDKKAGKSSGLLKSRPLNADEIIILHLRGGSFIRGSPASHRALLGSISAETRMRCFTIDYRKAPKFPFPAQLHDTLIAFLYLLKKGFKIENIVLLGDSAGAQLVLPLLFLLRRFNMHKVKAAILISPLTNIAVPTSTSVEMNKRFDYLHLIPLDMPTAPQRLFFKPGCKFTPQYIEETKNPLISPANGDFRDFPPVLVQAGEKEMLLDQARALYMKIKKDNPEGVVEFQVIADAIHVPQLFAFRPEADEASAKVGEFVKLLG